MLCDAYMTGSVGGSWSGAAGTEVDETSVRGRPSPGVQRCLGEPIVGKMRRKAGGVRKG